MRIAMVLLILAGGCELLHKPESTHFRATREGFEFRAIADGAYPEDTSNGEAWRMKWLEQHFAKTRICPGGYDITGARRYLSKVPD
jgi:hypothetical protein